MQGSRLAKIFVVTLLLSLSVSAEENSDACNKNCVTSYGDVLGVTKNRVISYSNCNNRCVIFENEKYQGTYTGIKWQCVEFARRWLLINHNVIFSSVNTAADMWKETNEYVEVGFEEKRAVESIKNGSERLPKRGDLLIYGKELFGTGHVAVVLFVDKTKEFISVAEQNFSNLPWVSDFSRRIKFEKINNKFWLKEQYLIGWKSQSLSDK